MFLLACAGWHRRWWTARSRRERDAEFVATPEEAGEWLAREARDGDVVLLKGIARRETGEGAGNAGKQLAVGN